MPGSSEQAQFLGKAGEALQEGALPMTPQQKAEIIANLPAGLTEHGEISSASISHILAATDPSGNRIAVKVKRLGIREALDDNIRVMNVFIDGTNSFVQTHAQQGVFTNKLQMIAKALPFGLETLKKTVVRDLDFVSERQIQHKASEVFNDIPGIIVPSIIEEYSDNNHIAMEEISAESFKALPANPKRVENLIAFGLQSWRKRFFHGDLHGRNIKSHEDGSLVVYDWSKSVDLSPRFVGNVGRLMYAMTRQNPKAIARAYNHIQAHPESDKDPTQIASLEAIEKVANDAIQRSKEAGRSKNIAKNGMIQDFLMTMGSQHQSALNVDYFVFLKSAKDFKEVVKSELEKPEYQNKSYRRKVLAKGFVNAFKTVYSRKR